MTVVICIFGFMILVAGLGWACELHYRRGGVLPSPSRRMPAHPLFSAGVVAALVACGAVPDRTRLATGIVVAAMALLGWARWLRAAGMIGLVAIPVLAGLALAVDPRLSETGAASLHVYTALTFLFSLACVVIDVLRAGPPAPRTGAPPARLLR